MVILACLFGAASLLPLLLAERGGPGNLAAVIPPTSFLLLLCVSAIILVNARATGQTNGIRVFALGPWYLVATAVGFAITSYAWTIPQGGSSAQIRTDSVVAALYLVCLAVAAWTIGYTMGPPQLLRAGAARVMSQVCGSGVARLRSPATPSVFFGIGLLGKAGQLRAGQYGYLSDPRQLLESPSPFTQALLALSDMTLFGIVLATIAAVQAGAPKSRYGILSTMLAIEVLLGLLAGHKIDFLFALLGPLVVFAIARPRLMRPLLIFGVIGFLFVTQFVGAYREVVRSDGRNISAREATAALPSILSATATTNSFTGTATASREALATRMRAIDNVAIIVQKSPEIPPVGVAPLFSAPVLGVVPRAIWPAKPVLATGYEFSQQYYGTSSSIRSSAAVTTVGDLYRHAGVLAVVIGMVCLGAAIRLVDDVAHPWQNLRYTLVYVSLFASFIDIEAGVVGLVAGLPRVLGVALVASYLAFRPQSGNESTAVANT